MNKEVNIYDVLQYVFLDTKINDSKNIVNLMKIESSYSKKIKKLLKDDINKVFKKYPAFIEQFSF